jgi:hypothetical protein
MSSYCNRTAVPCFSSGPLPRFHFLELLFGIEMTGQEMRHYCQLGPSYSAACCMLILWLHLLAFEFNLTETNPYRTQNFRPCLQVTDNYELYASIIYYSPENFVKSIGTFHNDKTIYSTVIYIYVYMCVCVCVCVCARVKDRSWAEMAWVSERDISCTEI